MPRKTHPTAKPPASKKTTQTAGKTPAKKTADKAARPARAAGKADKPKAAPRKSGGPKANKPRTPKTVISAAPSREQISVRAYEIWLRKGRPQGHDEQNWLEAEAELKVRG